MIGMNEIDRFSEIEDPPWYGLGHIIFLNKI